VVDRPLRIDVPLSPGVAALFVEPRHAGKPQSGLFRHGIAGAVKSGSLVEFWLAAQEDRIVQARFEAFGCPATIACGEWLCRWLVGREVEAAQRLTGLELADALALPAAKRAVALVAEDALKAALAAAEDEADDGSEGERYGA
jgi:NifU-like protein involved in Fe-S cluster formation